MGRLETKHWILLIGGTLTALAAMLGAATHWGDVLKPQAIGGFCAQMAVLLGAIFAGAPQNPNLNAVDNPSRRVSDPLPASKDLGSVSDATKRGLLGVVLLGLSLGLVSCAAKAPLQQIQITHDALATAQDLEVNLCLGVPNVAAAMALPDVKHCSAPTAPLIKLTDARHAAITAQFTTAITLHKSITAQFAAGATKVDLTSLNAVITALLSEIAQLQPTSQVQQLSAVVESARIK